jgi:hypothetical protein
MADERLDLADDPLELLRQAMSVEPSAGFLPRVRERVASERPGFRFSWRLPLAAAVSAGVLVVGLWLPRSFDQAVVSPQVPVPVARGAAPVAPPPAASSSRSSPMPAREARSRSARRSTRSAASSESQVPEVIIDPRQRAALATMFQMVREGHLTEEAFAQTTPPSTRSIREQVSPVGVSPVQVSPIAVGGVQRMGTEYESKRPASAGLEDRAEPAR